MARQSSKKGQTLGHRDIIQTRLALEFLRAPGDESLLTSEAIFRNFYEGHISRSSLHKTLKRDRDLLASEGIHLREIQNGTAKSWKLDEAKMKPVDIVSDWGKDKKTRAYAVLMRALLGAPETPNRRDLGFAITRMALGTGAGSLLSAPRKYSPKAQAHVPTFAQALHERKPVEMLYQAKADAKPVARTLKVYGMFPLGDQVYAVGLRVKAGAADEIRTFNLDRVESAEIADCDAGAYEIPADFDIKVYQKFPFEIGGDKPVSATFYFQRGVKDKLPESIKHRSTFVTHQGGSGEVTFDDVRNIEEAARWAIRKRAIPLSPASLVEEWERILGEARA